MLLVGRAVRGRDSRHLFSARGTQSPALHRSSSSACWTSRVNILRPRNRAQVSPKWKSLVLWKMRGFRTPAQVKPSLLEWSLKLGFKAPPGQGGVAGKQRSRKLAPGTDNGHQGTESLSRKNSVRWSVSHQPAVHRSMSGMLS